MNSMLVIHPYKYEGVWVFDDARVGLLQEPFVAGADLLLDRVTEGIANAKNGVTLLFSAQPFPGFQYEFVWRREGEFGGNWYYSPTFDQEGWLCPALFKYFDRAPEHIYVQVRAKSL
jgi:hypothetical protein